MRKRNKAKQSTAQQTSKLASERVKTVDQFEEKFTFWLRAEISGPYIFPFFGYFKSLLCLSMKNWLPNALR